LFRFAINIQIFSYVVARQTKIQIWFTFRILTRINYKPGLRLEYLQE